MGTSSSLAVPKGDIKPNFSYNVSRDIAIWNIFVYLAEDELWQIRALSRACKEMYFTELKRRCSINEYSIVSFIIKKRDTDLLMTVASQLSLESRCRLMTRVQNNIYTSNRFLDNLSTRVICSTPKELMPELVDCSKKQSFILAVRPYIISSFMTEDEFVNRFCLYFDVIYGSWWCTQNPAKILEIHKQHGQVSDEILKGYLRRTTNIFDENVLATLVKTLRNDPSIFQNLLSCL